MRTLSFIVSGHNIKPDPKCDFTDLMPGSKAPLQAKFTFSKEWQDAEKVVGFYSRLGKEYTPQHLKDGKTCMIPIEALQKQFFKLKVVSNTGLVTNKLTIEQTGGNV